MLLCFGLGLGATGRGALFGALAAVVAPTVSAITSGVGAGLAGRRLHRLLDEAMSVDNLRAA